MAKRANLYPEVLVQKWNNLPVQIFLKGVNTPSDKRLHIETVLGC